MEDSASILEDLNIPDPEEDNKPEVPTRSPWDVSCIEDFLYFCCPECNLKHETKTAFVIHAVDAHPDSRPFISTFDLKEEKDYDDLSDFVLADYLEINY